MDQWTKATKRLITEELNKSGAALRGAATDSGPPGQHIHSGPPAFRGGNYIIEFAIAFPSQSFFPLLPNQIILFQLLKSFSFVCNGKVIIFRFGIL